MSSFPSTSRSAALRRGAVRRPSVEQCSGAGRSHRWRAGPNGLPGGAVIVQGCLERWEPDRRQATPCRQIATDRRTGLSDAVGLMRRAGSEEQDAREGIEQPGADLPGLFPLCLRSGPHQEADGFKSSSTAADRDEMRRASVVGDGRAKGFGSVQTCRYRHTCSARLSRALKEHLDVGGIGP